MDSVKKWAVLLGSMMMVSLMVVAAQQDAWGVSYVHLDGEAFLETHVPDTVQVTADCAQPGNRLTAEIFLDLNENGIVDGNEQLIQFVYLNDGIPSLEDGEDEIPGDDDALVNGQLLHYLELMEEEYSFSTVPMQFIIQVTDQDHSSARAVLRVLPPVTSRPYIGGTVAQSGTAAPLDSMVVVAYETSTGDYRATLSREGGQYVLNVEAGEWRVFAWDLRNYYAPSDSQTVTVAGQDSAAADFFLSPHPAFITGNIDSSGSKPVPGIMVVAIEGGENFRVGWTQADGHYRIGLPGGTYDVYPMFLPRGYACQPPSYTNVVVDSGQTVANKNFLLGHPTSRIEGRVTYQTGEGASGVTIRAFSGAGYYSAITEEDGGYSLAVFPAVYIISAELAGYEVIYPTTQVHFFVTVGHNETTTGWDFVIAPSGGPPAAISGTVTYRSSGQPAQGVYVVIFHEEENSSLGWNFTQTDTTGSYRFGDIIDGTWLIGVYEPGYDSDPLLREATVSFGVSASDQDFELVTATSVPLSQEDGLPGRYYLFPNRPNPFNSQTLIAYSVLSEEPQEVSLKVYNVLGQEVCTLVDEPQSGGFKVVSWDGRDLTGMFVSSGIYFCQLVAGDHRQVRKLVLLR